MSPATGVTAPITSLVAATRRIYREGRQAPACVMAARDAAFWHKEIKKTRLFPIASPLQRLTARAGDAVDLPSPITVTGKRLLRRPRTILLATW
jgi:hypothetical protein